MFLLVTRKVCAAFCLNHSFIKTDRLQHYCGWIEQKLISFFIIYRNNFIYGFRKQLNFLNSISILWWSLVRTRFYSGHKLNGQLFLHYYLLSVIWKSLNPMLCIYCLFILYKHVSWTVEFKWIVRYMHRNESTLLKKSSGNALCNSGTKCWHS